MKYTYLLVSLLVLMAVATVTQAQKFAYVDSDYILEQIPEYIEAQKELDRLSLQWQREVEGKYAEIDKLYRDYQSEEFLLTAEMKKSREEEIIQKEKEAKAFQKQKFGVEGELYEKRQDLVKPIQDRIYNAIKDMATASSYSIVLDKAGQSNILYTDGRFDKSDVVLKKLGIKAGSR